ncbi:MAG: DPP IV N-terminal domain-containing protein, partial [Rikenellaceae bacterium]
NSRIVRNIKKLEFSGNEKKILFTTDIKHIYRHSFKADYWIYDLITRELKPLSTAGAQQVATISPDGKKAAFVRDNNLFWVDLASFEEHQITTDGKFNYILNGIPDWVYEEEYSFARAYEWSPESDAIAFYRTDESRVEQYKMNVFTTNLYPEVYQFKYPKAGEENSVVSIHAFNLESGNTVAMNIGDEKDQYIPRIKWSSQDGKLLVFRLNRHQNNFDMLLCDDKSGQSEVVYNEQNDRYIERINDGTVTFLPSDDRIIVLSEKDGFMHLYLYDMGKRIMRQITTGNWEVTEVMGVDAKKEIIYYISTEKSPLERNLYSIKFNGKERKCLTPEKGTYSVAPSVGFKYFISYFSNSTTPTLVRLHSGADGKVVRVLEENKELKDKLAEYKVAQKEFFKFKTSEGVELYAYMIKPTDFDGSKKYPVFMTQYSGPGSQSVANRFGMGWEMDLVNSGYIVACVDGRGTGFRGEDFKKCTYKDLGHLEVVDQIEGAKYLGTLPFVDASRIGIFGWSYGGFMSLNCILKGNDVFKAAIAVAPVTSWRYYDSIYTELYNGLPQENPKGYDDNSPVNFADRLKGKLLIAHGTGDDNVHIQNTMSMIRSLTKAGKPFEMLIYPDENHGMGASAGHLMNKCIDFIKTN